MANKQKGVQQDTAYSAVVVNGIPVPISFLTQKGHTRRMHGIVGERERSNCVVDMRCI